MVFIKIQPTIGFIRQKSRASRVVNETGKTSRVDEEASGEIGMKWEGYLT